MKRVLGIVVALLLGLWWLRSTPPAHVRIADSVQFDPAAAQAIAAVDYSAAFEATLETAPSDLPGHDDVVFLQDRVSALVSAMDGRIWKVDRQAQTAEVFVDPPLMASGLHEAPGDHDVVYFCASVLHGETYPAGEAVGLYRLDLKTRAITPVVLHVPDARLGEPVVYADADARAPQSPGATTRPLAFCNDLEVSADGRRIYFSEPFAYAGAAMGGKTVAEAVSLGGNGRLWRHDLDTGITRLVAAGFHFIDGVLYDLHPGLPREQSVIVSQTPHFRLTRFFLAGAKAGTAETVVDGLPGMPDGLDRDRNGNIWSGLLKQRSGLLTWLHANAWIKPLFLRLPLDRAPQSRWTGVLALSPDGSKPVYFASTNSPALVNIASAIPGPDGVYLTPFDAAHRGLVRLPYPKALQ